MLYVAHSMAHSTTSRIMSAALHADGRLPAYRTSFGGVILVRLPVLLP